MNPILRIEIPIDPATIGTAQQKRVNHKTGRFFTPAKTAKAMTAIAAVVRSAAIVQKWQAEPPRAMRCAIEFRYRVPPSRRVPPPDGSPCAARWAGDADNRAKAVLDAVTKSGVWHDDQYVTTLLVRKVWTHSAPAIVIAITEDTP